MSVTRADVAAIATLARLRLSPDEAERLAAELSEILAHVAVLEAVDVEAVAAATGAAEGAAPLRADAVGPDALVAGPASFAPEWRAGFFTVPRLPALDRDADDPT